MCCNKFQKEDLRVFVSATSLLFQQDIRLPIRVFLISTKPTNKTCYTYKIYFFGYNSERVNSRFSCRLIYYFDVLITYMIMKIGNKVIFKVKLNLKNDFFHSFNRSRALLSQRRRGRKGKSCALKQGEREMERVATRRSRALPSREVR